jgi:hypothetical protein
MMKCDMCEMKLLWLTLRCYPSISWGNLYRPNDIVTYVRFPWLSNISTAVTMDSTMLLHFLSYATILDGLSAIGG